MTDTGPLPRTAVVIPHFNDGARLRRCLAALAPQRRPDVEIVVVDNGSDEDLSDLGALLPGLRLVVEPAPGAAPARNRGVAETRAPMLAFLDCDCLPDPDWLDAVQRVAERADLVGGRVAVFDETPPPRSGAEAFEAVFAFDNRGYVTRKGFSVTANLVTRRAVFEAVGGFRAGLSEDLDWCRRATAAGFALAYAEDLRVGHPSRSDWAALRRKWLRLTEEAWGLRGRGAASRLGWALRALAMPLSALAHLPRVLRSDRLDTAAERRAAAATLIRLRCNRCVWMLSQAAGACRN